MDRIEAWFDGACQPANPGGHAGWGALVQSNGQDCFRGSGYVGFGAKMSCNVAEYAGVCVALVKIISIARPGDRVSVYGDSTLVVNQLNGRWKAKVGHGGLYLPYYAQAKKLMDQLVARCPTTSLTWIPRESNTVCDVLSKRAACLPKREHNINPSMQTAMLLGVGRECSLAVQLDDFYEERKSSCRRRS